jgi:hypothetical protein
MPANVAGRNGLPPLAELTYFDLHFGYLLMDSRWPVGNIEEFPEALTSGLHR